MNAEGKSLYAPLNESMQAFTAGNQEGQQFGSIYKLKALEMLMKQNLEQVNDDKALIVIKKQTSKDVPLGFSVSAVGRTNEYASDTGNIIQKEGEVGKFDDEGQITN